jgi:7,8-dihydropterin-6-yl-methyl-4-(beta-D-ribofuranosyl)aminobenzene 5'-phosphate synthase
MTDIPPVNAWDTHFDNLFVMRNGRLELDQFSDEQFLVFADDGALIVMSGCSHRGITNILNAAAEAFSSEAARRKANASIMEAATALPERGPVFKLVVGGFHLHNADDKTANSVVRALDAFRIERLGCCHWTASSIMFRIKSVFRERAFYGWTGQSSSCDAPTASLG